MRRTARPPAIDRRAPWQIAQAAACGCRGMDDMCVCQNVEAGTQPPTAAEIVAMLDDPPREVWAACGDAIVELHRHGRYHHDDTTTAVLRAALAAARKLSRHSPDAPNAETA